MRKAFLLLAGTCIAGIYSFAQEKQDSLRLINLQEVQVVSTRAGVNIPVAYTNIGKEEIKKQNFGQDIPFLLTLSPLYQLPYQGNRCNTYQCYYQRHSVERFRIAWRILG